MFEADLTICRRPAAFALTSTRIVAVFLALSTCGAGCVHPLVRPAAPPRQTRTDALLVLPGFGYGPAGENALKSVAATAAAEGIDLFVPTYISRDGIPASREKLARFIEEQQLGRYQRLHVFAFLAGAWTFNPLESSHPLPNLTGIVYDRSPYQERATRVARDTLHFLTWIRYGSPVFDVANTPYPPLTDPNVKVGIVVETVPTTFIRKRATLVKSYGPIQFECDALAQPHDDCMYVPLSHDQLYVRFADVWPEVLSFIKSGHFTADADRSLPMGDALQSGTNR